MNAPTPSTKRSRDAAEAAGITSPLLEMALRLGEGEVNRAQARRAITQGDGNTSKGTPPHNLSQGILTDPYLLSMVELFPGEDGSPQGSNDTQGLQLRGEQGVKYLEGFNYGEFLRDNIDGVVGVDPWMKAVLLGEITPEQMSMATPLLGYGVSPLLVLEFIRHVDKTPREQLHEAQGLLAQLKRTYHATMSTKAQWSDGETSARKRWRENVVAQLSNFMGEVENDSMHQPHSPEGSTYEFDGNFHITSRFLALAERVKGVPWKQLSNHDLLTFHVQETIARRMIAATTEYLLHCEMHMDDNPCTAVKLGNITLSTEPVRKVLAHLRDGIMEQGEGSSISPHEWPGDLLLTLSSLGDKLNFFSLCYYGELQGSYNKQWAEAACDWEAMGEHAPCLERAIALGESGRNNQDPLEALSAIVHGDRS